MAKPQCKNHGREQSGRPTAAELLQLELRSTLEASWLCKVRAIQSRGGTLNVLFTVRQDLENAWFAYLALVLRSIDRLPFQIEFRQKYMLLHGRLVAPWLLVLETENAVELHIAVRGLREAFLRVINPAVDQPHEENFEWFQERMAQERFQKVDPAPPERPNETEDAIKSIKSMGTTTDSTRRKISKDPAKTRANRQ